METNIALRALTGTGSAWRAVGRGMGLLVLLYAIYFLFSHLLLQFVIGDLSAYMEALRGPYGMLISALMGCISQLMSPRLWFALCLAFMLRRYFASETWHSEIKVLPIAAHVFAFRILAVLFLIAIAYHLFAYAVSNAYWFAIVFIIEPGGSHFWPWGLLVGPFYFNRHAASLPEILINEPLGHAMGVFMTFLHLTAIVTLALYLRNMIKAAIVYAAVWWLAWGAVQALTIPMHRGVQWLTQKFLEGDPGVLAGNVVMWTAGMLLVLCTTGVLCRLLEGRILRLMDE